MLEQAAVSSPEMDREVSPMSEAASEDECMDMDPMETATSQEEEEAASPGRDAEAAVACTGSPALTSVTENECVSSPGKAVDAFVGRTGSLEVMDASESGPDSLLSKDEPTASHLTQENSASPSKMTDATANGVAAQISQPAKVRKAKPSAVRDYPEGVGRGASRTAVRDFPALPATNSSKADAFPKAAHEKAIEGSKAETSLKFAKITYVSPKERAKKAAKASKVQDEDLVAEVTTKADTAPVSTSTKEQNEIAAKVSEARANDENKVDEVIVTSDLPPTSIPPKELTKSVSKVIETQVKDMVEEDETSDSSPAYTSQKEQGKRAVKQSKVKPQEKSTSHSIPAVRTPKEQGKRAEKGSKKQLQEKDTSAEATVKPGVTPKNTKRSKPATPNSRPSAEVKRPRRSAGKGSKQASQSLEGVDSAGSRKAFQTALRTFDALRRNLLQQDEIKGKEKGNRADLTAGGILNSNGLSINRSKKCVGSVPGLEVGDHFYFRMEMACIGMHGPIQAGIDYLTAKENEWNAQIAISIISSGDHDDDRDDGEQLIYTGQGGKSSVDKSGENQKLERGNLALDGSKIHGVPVRVVRGLRDITSPSGKIYTYDGLYKVESSWTEKGKGGFEEFKFRLIRMPDQPELGSSMIKLVNKLKNKPSIREGLLLEDISKKKENVPVCVVNTVDNEEAPTSFEYSTKVRYDCGQLEAAESCECKGACKTSEDCTCFSRNGNVFPYLSSGYLVRERNVIFECGTQCKCATTCRNRVTQKGVTCHLEIFKTEDRGWGVRAWDPIPAGSFICEYTGKATSNLEALEEVGANEYVLNMKLISKMKSNWGDVSNLLENSSVEASEEFDRPDLLMDASKTGNVSRFINHSCSPNLFAQCVLHDHNDFRFPHIMLFAMDNIPPLRELTLDYGSDEMEENSTGFPLRSMDCLCGSAECRGKVYY